MEIIEPYSEGRDGYQTPAPAGEDAINKGILDVDPDLVNHAMSSLLSAIAHGV